MVGTSASETFKMALKKSMLLSADVAHAIHPNYAAKHDGNHQPKLNGGTVLKTNDNQRYATDAVSGAWVCLGCVGVSSLRGCISAAWVCLSCVDVSSQRGYVPAAWV